MSTTAANGIRWTSSYILMMSIALFSVRPLCANTPVPTLAQSTQLVRMQDMHWQSSLSAKQVSEVRSAIASTYYPAVEAALTNVVLHRLSDLLPIVENRAGELKSASLQHYCRVCAEVLNPGRDLIDQLRETLKTELPGDEFIANCEKMDHCRFVRRMITSLIVVEELRAVRAGRKKEPGLHAFDLSPFETELVKYSQLASTAAIETILRELSRAKVAGKQEHILVGVLHTYPHEEYLTATLIPS